MSKHNKIGIKGEQIAADYLLTKGYIILHRNWRSKRLEIDIIALKDDILAIVEIKTRSSKKTAFPEEAVTRRKQHYLKTAAADFSELFPEYMNVRFDIVSIIIDKDEATEILHFEEAFY